VAVASAGPNVNQPQTDNHTSIPPLSCLQARYPSCRPTNSVIALKAFSTEGILQQLKLELNFWCIKLSKEYKQRHNFVLTSTASNDSNETNTHTHTQPFYGFLDFVRVNPGEPVPEGTFCHLLDFLVNNEDNTGRRTNNPDGLPPHPD